MRTSGLARYSTLLAAVVLAIGFLPIAPAALAEGELPSFAVYPYQGSSNYVWGIQWSGPVDLYVDDDYDLGNGVLFESLGIPVDEAGWFSAQQQFDDFQIERGQIVTVTDSINTKVHQVSNAWIISFDFEHDTISGRAAPDSNIEVLTGPPGDERSIGRNVTTDVTGRWIADFSVPSGINPMDATFDVAPGTDATANQTDDDNDMTGIDVIAPAQVHRQMEVYPGLDIVSVWWETASVFSLTIERDGVVVYSKSDHPGAFDVGSDGFDLMAGDLVFVSDDEMTKDHLVTDQVITSVDPDTNIVTGTATDGTDLYIQFDSVFGGDESGEGYAGPVEYDGSGTWSLDLTGLHDVQAGSVIEATYFDPPNGDIEDNDQTKAVEWLPLPTITAHPSDLIVGEGWPVDVPVSISIDDFTVDPPPVPEQRGIFPWETYFATGLHNESAQTAWVLEPDNVVTASSGSYTKIHVVVAVSFDELNMEGDFAAGTAPADTTVEVSVRNGEEPFHTSSALAGSGGAWFVDFDAAGFDITAETGGLARVSDDDYDATVVGIGPEGGGGEPGPEHRQIEVYREFNVVLAWESEDPLSLTVTRGGAEVYSDTAFYGFDLWQDGFELKVNDLVTVTDGDTTKEHVVRSQTVDGLLADPENPNRVTGTAEPGTYVGIRYNTIRSGLSDDNIENATVTADASGHWSYEFATAVIAGTAVEVSQGDSPETDNDSTLVVAYVPLPTITAHPPAFIEGRGWPVGVPVSIDIDGFSVDPQPVPERHGGFPWDTYFSTGLYNETTQTGWLLEPDDVVTATNGLFEKVHTVTGLTVDGVDDAADIVFGHAQPSSEVQVALWDTESDPHVERVVSADATTGYWEADFSTAVGSDGWQQARDVTMESQGGAWQSDDDYDTTQIDFGPGGAEPVLMAQANEDIWVRGYGYDGLGPLEVRVIDESGLPSCPGTIPFEGEFEAFGADLLCEGGDLVGGHHIGVYTPGAEGELIRDLTIHDVRITAVDVGADSVSGVGTSGVPVQVGIYEEGEDEPVTLALRYAMPDTTTGEWTVDFNAEPNLGAGEFGKMGIGGREGDARQYEEDGDFTESQWADRQPHMYVNLLADTASIEAWPTGLDATLEVFESDASAIPVHSETISALPGPYYLANMDTDLGGIDVLSGNHVVVSNGDVELSHTVTEIAITSFDFDNDSFTGTAFDGTTVAAGAWNDTTQGGVDGLVARPWIADFGGQVDFSEYNRISGYVAEFDTARNATFFRFDAEYEELTVAPNETSVTTADGSVTVEGLGEDDEISVVTGPPAGSSGGFEYVGETLKIESDATGTLDDPLILTLRIEVDDIPSDLDPEDIVVFKDGVVVSNCVLPLDTADDFPCVSERLRLEPSGDIKLTVQTLSFSTWTMAFRSVTIAQFTATAEPVAVGTDVTVTGAFLDVGKTQATGLTATVTWHESGECEVVPVIDNGIAASHTYLDAGVFTPTLRLYAGSATDCATAKSFELIDEAAYQYVVVYDPDGGFVTGGGWIYSTAGSYVSDPTLEGVATFGFVSKYKKGATVPTGNTEFQFHAGDLNFHSSIYDWLVVTGTPAAMFKGVGTINGIGEYKFVIWAGDGEPDTFRIKIWEEDAGVETVIYDNGSAQAIGGGSIIIHTKK